MTDKATYDLYWALDSLVTEIDVMRSLLHRQGLDSVLVGLSPEIMDACEALDNFGPPPDLFDDTTKAEGSAA